MEQMVMGLNERARVLPKFKFNGNNRAEFLDKFPEIAHHFRHMGFFTGEYERPAADDEGRPEWDYQNKEAIGTLRSCLTEDIFRLINVTPDQTAHELYQLLRELFLRDDLRSRVQLEVELDRCVKLPGTSLISWFAKLNGLFSELAHAGLLGMDDEWRKAKAATRIGEEWSALAEIYLTQDRITYAQFMAKLLAAEREKASFGRFTGEKVSSTISGFKTNGSEEGTLLYASPKYPFKGRGKNQRNGQFSRFSNRGRFSNNLPRSPQRQFNSSSPVHNSDRLSNVTCYHCGEKGHVISQCPKKKHGGEVMQASMEDSLSEQVLVAESTVLQCAQSRIDDDQNAPISTYFVIDGGCTHHMVDLPLLNEVQCNTPVQFGKRQAIATAVAVGDLKIGSITLTNVLRVPGIRYNLISEGQLDDKGCVITTANGNKIISRNGQTLFCRSEA
jgi:hypothetical protein